MASSHHLVTVCLCLLCASHLSCSAHDGSIAPPQGFTDYQNVRPERLKGVGDIQEDRYSKDYSILNYASEEDWRSRGNDVAYDRNDRYSETTRRPYNKRRYDELKDNSLRHRRRQSLLGSGRGKIEGSNEFHSDISRRIEDIESRIGASPHLEELTAIEKKNLRLSKVWMRRNDVEPRVIINIFEDGRVAQDAVPSAGVRLKSPLEPIDRVRSDEHLNSRTSAESNQSGDEIRFKRKKRDAHLQDGHMKTADNSSDYKIALKNIDVDFYIKKLFIQFGDRDSMTMDLAGFDQMLKELDLDRMVLDHGSVPPIETIVNGVRSNSTNVACVNSADLVSSITAQQVDPHAGHSHSHAEEEPTKPANQSLQLFKGSIKVGAKLLRRICPILLYQKVAPTSYERQGCVVEREYPKSSGGKLDAFPLHVFENDDVDDFHEAKISENRTAVWIYSSLCILAISACGLLGVAVIPIMHHVYYQQILQFFVALAVGTLSGDALLHLLPHALSPDSHGHGKGSEHSHNDSMWKGLVAMMGVVFFYFTEKGLMLITEWRKRRMRNDADKNKFPPTVRVMRNDFGCLKGSGSFSSHTEKDGFLKLPTALSVFKPSSNRKSDDANAVPSSGKICKHKYSEYPYCYDEIATETTETHDDHHVRNNAKNDKGLCVLSFSSMAEKESANTEPDVNDSLLSDSKTTSAAGRTNNKEYFKGDASAALDGANKPEANGGKKKSGVHIKEGHVRSRSADRAMEIEDLELKKFNPEEYTVILREHSQTHHGHSHSHGHVHSPPSSLSSVVWMVIMGDGLHNFTDGMAIGAAFSSNIAGGFSTAIAVLCHELPHEIGDFAVLLKAGMSAKRAVCYNLLSSILCLLGMVVGIIAGHAPEATAWIFAAAAGMFLYIALVDMIPELSSSHSNEGSLCQCLLQFSGLVCGIGIMLLIAMYEHDLKKLFD